MHWKKAHANYESNSPPLFPYMVYTACVSSGSLCPFCISVRGVGFGIRYGGLESGPGERALTLKYRLNRNVGESQGLMKKLCIYSLISDSVA